MAVSADTRSAVFENGFAIVERVLESREISRLLAAFENARNGQPSVRKRGGVFAVRNLLDVIEIAELARSTKVNALVEEVLGADFKLVRGILFDKIPEANWKVPWHQDVTIAVWEKIDAPGFGPWSVKAGVLHVQPPASILENMISIRLHLDPCGEINGALRVIPGSHRHGRIPEDEISSFRTGTSEHVCSVGEGGALLMRPLLLHASSPSQLPGHRRVVHLDFASAHLPAGMQWHAESTTESF
jgi:ectoine hydroxylase-related dioxygenase (phytanoyl-CoA dioxygenase family)